ncbi:MAG: hypothetical protein R3286_09925 [Gammaproteobacteria bacterium]|nr:hypothetical protein [Gammaproteobacteria bacterium]
MTLACAATALVVLASCAAPAPVAPEFAGDDALGACRAVIGDIDRRIARAGVGDGQAARVPGFPYLRVNRLLAAPALRPSVDSPAFEAWVTRMRALDAEARGFELANLGLHDADAPAQSHIEECADTLAADEIADEGVRRRLLEAARVPDDYVVAARVLGLYPLTSVPFKIGVTELHDSFRDTFAVPLDRLPVRGSLARYVPPTDRPPVNRTEVRTLLRAMRRDPLGIPRPDAADAQRLLAAFAPIIEVDEVSDDDRIGAPIWDGAGVPSVDVGRPTVYTRISHTRFRGEVLLQLNYVMWFPARTRDGAVDLLAGRLDGLTFRVTLDGDGRPIMHDSMHNCGCYHLFLPGSRLVQRPPPARYEEPPLVIALAESGAGRATLRLSHGSHYLQRLRFTAAAPKLPEDITFALDDADTLRSLPLPVGGRRSLYAPDGIVLGTERAERWLFWPMGVASPGAMRQWGRHAIAFVGRRHFDDPDLIERYFVPAPSDSAGARSTP